MSCPTEEPNIKVKTAGITIIINNAFLSQALVEELKQNIKIENLLLKDTLITLNTKKGERIMEDVFNLAAKHNTRLNSINVKSPTLEDVFLSLTGHGLRD